MKREEYSQYIHELNNRFDERMELLLAYGYRYSLNHHGWAKSPREFENGSYLSEQMVMFSDDIYFNVKIGEEVLE